MPVALCCILPLSLRVYSFRFILYVTSIIARNFINVTDVKIGNFV